MAIGANNVIIDKYCQKLPHINISFLDPFFNQKGYNFAFGETKGYYKRQI